MDHRDSGLDLGVETSPVLPPNGAVTIYGTGVSYMGVSKNRAGNTPKWMVY